MPKLSEVTKPKQRKLSELQQYGPGLGMSAGPNDAQLIQQNMAGAPPDPTAAFIQGGIRGALATPIGIAQIATRINPGIVAADMVSDGKTLPKFRNAADMLAGQLAQDRANDPGANTLAGRVGEVTGGIVSTTPLGALSIPAKGAGMLPMIGRGAISGAAVAATQPVDGGNFAAQKGNQVLQGATAGAVIPALLRGTMATAERVGFAPNTIAQIANAANAGANKRPFAAESEALSQRTGIPFTPGQVSGSKVQTGLENMARQSIFSADRAFEADKRTADATVSYVNRLMDNITKNPGSEATVGAQIQAATRGVVEKIAGQRDKVAAQQYGAIDAALKGRKFVQPTNTLRALDELISEYKGVPTPEADRIVAQAQAIKDRLSQSGPASFSDAQKLRTYYGKAARGGASVFDQVSPDINRRVAAKIFGAVSDDIEQSADALGGIGPGLVPAGTVGLKDAINSANANYRRYSQMLEATKSHPIARLFGDNFNIDDVMVFDKIPPETVISRLGNMSPTELRMVRDYMDQNAPDTWQQYKRLIVERALQSAQTLPTSAGANVVPFNASQFVRALGGDKPDKVKKLEAVFGSDELAQIDDAIQAARRLGDRFGYNGSGTGPYMEVQNLLNSLKNRGVQAAASSLGEGLGLRKVANVMLNADGRRALIQLSKLPPQSRQAASLVGFITSLARSQNVQQPNQGQHQQDIGQPAQ